MRRTILILFMIAAAAACTERDAERPLTGDAPPAMRALASIPTQLVGQDPCAWVTAADAGRLLGPLAGPPVRVESAERTNAAADGSACLYQLSRPSGELSYAVAVEVVVDGALTLQTGLGATLPSVGEDLVATTGPAGSNGNGFWDWVGGYPGLLGFRRGHIAILMAESGSMSARHRLDSLAAMIVARIPDIPFTQAAADPAIEGSAPDPCGLVAAEEVEAVLGPLPVPPFRARESSALVRGNGASCTYYLGDHRVLTLTPTWDGGVLAFQLATGSIALAATALVNEDATDTLQGSWDQMATGLDGDIYLVKGDRMLTISHRLAAIAPAAVTALARKAADRM